MKTKKYRKITHRKHYRKKNIIKSKKVHKSTRRNNKKRYKGGSLVMSPIYTFDSVHNMLSSLQMLINNKKELYEASILEVILKDIINATTNKEKTLSDTFDTFPELIKLILKLEVKPSNTLEFIYFILGLEKDDNKDLKTQLKDLLDDYPGLIKFIDKNRNESEIEDYEVGWSLLSSLVVVLFEFIYTVESIGFNLKENINIVYNEDSIIQCGLIDALLDNNDDVDPRGNKTKVDNFYDIFLKLGTTSKNRQTMRRNTMRRDTVQREPIKTIYDFFDETKNPTGIMPPFVLFILSCRINPRINDDTTVMKENRMTILKQIQYYLTICCKRCCVGDECTDSKCVKGESKMLDFFKRGALEKNICSKSSCMDEFNWRTFDNIFKKATNNGSIVQRLIEKPLFYNIAPLSTFLPINANTYIKDVFYKKEKKKDKNIKIRKEFDDKIAFYENEIYKAYKQSVDGLCSIEDNNDLCEEYIKKGPLYIPYKLLLIIIEKYKNKNKPLTLATVMGRAGINRDTIHRKAESASEEMLSYDDKRDSSNSQEYFEAKEEIEHPDEDV